MLSSLWGYDYDPHGLFGARGSARVRHREALLFSRLVGGRRGQGMGDHADGTNRGEDVLSTSSFTISLLGASLSVGRVVPDALQGCAWPLLKAMFGAASDSEATDVGFFCLTQEKDELTLLMDERCRAAFDDADGVATVEYAPHQWRAFELRLGSLGWEVPGLVCFLATLMAENDISILNLSSHDRDFLLVQEADVDAASRVIRQGMSEDVVGLKESISEKAMVRRSGSGVGSNNLSAADLSFLDEPLDTVLAARAIRNDSRAVEALDADRAAEPPAEVASGGIKGRGEKGGGEVQSSTSGGSSSSSGTGEAEDSRSRLRRLQPLHETLDGDRELFVKVLPTKLVVVRLERSMLQASTHALVHRIMFAPRVAHRCFWSYTQYAPLLKPPARSRPCRTRRVHLAPRPR